MREHDRWEDTPAVKIVRGGSGGASSERRSSDGGGKGRRGVASRKRGCGGRSVAVLYEPIGASLAVPAGEEAGLGVTEYQVICFRVQEPGPGWQRAECEPEDGPAWRPSSSR